MFYTTSFLRDFAFYMQLEEDGFRVDRLQRLILDRAAAAAPQILTAVDLKS